MIKSSCLDEETLTSYLEGLLDAPVRAAAESHLVDCDTCRSQLVYYMRILDEDVREEEESVIEAAMLAVEKGGPRLVAARRGRLWNVKWAAAAAAVLLAVSVGVFVDATRGPSAAEIIFLLYSNERPFESRVAVQPYLEYSATRNDSPGGAQIQVEIETTDEYLLGAYYLYQGRFDQAIRLLERTAAATPVASVHNDLGVAYLEQPVTTADQQAVNRSRAREHFERALQLDPQFAASVYNLAVLFHRENLPELVRVQLDRYLDLDPDSDWADELRQMTRAGL